MLLSYWHWLLLGFSLIVAELAVPGAFFIWIGIAAFLLGGLTLVFPLLTASMQFAVFGILTPLIMIMGRKIFRNQFRLSPPSLLNRRGHQLIGRVIVLDVPILHGQAHVTVGDSKWRVKGPDTPAGQEVRVVSVEGNVLGVAPPLTL